MANFLPDLQVAISALICNEPKIQLANTILYRLDMESLDGPFVDIIMKSSKDNPVAIIGLGNLITALFGIFSYFLIRTLMDEYGVSSLLLINNELILVVDEAAFLGGVVIILTMLKDFSLLRNFDPIFLFGQDF